MDKFKYSVLFGVFLSIMSSALAHAGVGGALSGFGEAVQMLVIAAVIILILVIGFFVMKPPGKKSAKSGNFDFSDPQQFLKWQEKLDKDEKIQASRHS